MADHLLVRENSRGWIRRYLKAFKSKYRVRFGDIFHGVPKISQQKASRSQQSQPVNNTRVSEITIRGGMLVTGACAYPRKSTSSAWLGSFPAADRRDDVALNMDLIEGRVRYRKGKKWKVRWAVLRRVNPATDVLNLVMYPARHAEQSSAGVRHKALLSLKGFSGLQVLNKMDKHFNVIIIITTEEVIPLSFETIDQRAEWLALLQGHFGKEKSFEGIVPHKQKIKAGEANLRFYNTFFSLTKKDNYRLIGHWKFTALPKYGALEGGFAFQARPDPLSGDKLLTYFFATRSGREIQQLFDSVCRADEMVPGQECQTDTNQPGTSEEDNTPQPSFLRRAWLRMSGKRPRKGKALRPRSRSMPSTSKKKAENTALRSPTEGIPSVRRNESVPANMGASRNPTDSLNEVFLGEENPAASSPKSPPPGYQNIAGVTPEGYEVMNPGDDYPLNGRKSSGTNSFARKESAGQRKSDTACDQPDGTQASELEGYVVVEGRDEELLEKIRTNSYAKDNRTSRGSESGRIKSSASDKRQSDRTGENGVIQEEVEHEGEQKKMSENEDQRLSNGEVQCHIVVTTTEDIDEERTNHDKDALMNGDDVFDTVAKENQRSRSSTNEKAAKNADCVNGDVTQNKDNIKADEKQANGDPKSVSTRRGMKNPPSLSLPPTTTIGSAEHLYVNSPKIVDYVNVKGSRGGPGSARSRGASKGQSGGKSKLNPYAMYDGNDDSIYHSVESLMPSHPGYQNVLADDPSRSHSFENIAGHSYANVAGAHPSYQNIGHMDRSYVNVMSKPHQGNLNYIKLEGVDSPHAPSLLVNTSPKSAKPSSDYTWIDERKTRLLKDTAKMHSERRQENLPRVMKK